MNSGLGISDPKAMIACWAACNAPQNLGMSHVEETTTYGDDFLANSIRGNKTDLERLARGTGEGSERGSEHGWRIQ